LIWLTADVLNTELNISLLVLVFLIFLFFMSIGNNF
jgi:hypothetical protein